MTDTHLFYITLNIFLIMVHSVLHKHRIAPTFLKFDLWSPGAGCIPIISTKGTKQIKKEK
jgi:hypothetical protein